MSSVLDRDALESSPLADLHLLANELGVDGFRRLRKPELIDSIIARQSGSDGEAPPAEPEAEAPAAADEDEAPAAAPDDETPPAAADDETPAAAADDEAPAAAADDETPPAAADDEAPAAAPESPDDKARGRRSRRGGRGRGKRDDAHDEAPAARAEPEAPPQSAERTAEGVVELLGNGSAFIRLNPPETTDDDVYISAAQVKRCELVSGDRVSGPLRAPRRSERFPSLVRVDTINGRPADEVAEGTRFDDLPATWPSDRLALDSEDVTLKAVEWLTPFGKGSRVLICGAPRAGKSDLARAIAAALVGREGLELVVVLAGVRPEEAGDWTEPAPAAAVSFAESAEAQAQAIEQAVEQGRRVAARGGDAVVVVDTLEWIAPAAARRALAAARNIADGGSLTVIATGPAPFGGETTVITLDAQQTALRRFPALELTVSGTLRPDALVGEAGAEAIAKARAEAAANSD